ncbi:hypothetical protein [Streptomyces fulvoviolaceus]|uniref:hypothetical protein n=1 Tax=Streptomyces fulvoviolaceus TaxID=285535 RepID=UPI0004C50D07|nr:hypothetical protein [Streptomyces fulvoviolaceus]
MTLADWLKFTPGWLAFLWAVGNGVWKGWWVRRHHLALGPEAEELRTQLTEFRALLEEVASGGVRSDWFMHKDRREAARALRDSAERRGDAALKLAMTRVADTWDRIFALAPPPRVMFRYAYDVRETRSGASTVARRREEALRDAGDIERVQKMAALAHEALLDVQTALSRLVELERRTVGRG